MEFLMNFLQPEQTCAISDVYVEMTNKASTRVIEEHQKKMITRSNYERKKKGI